MVISVKKQNAVFLTVVLMVGLLAGCSAKTEDHASVTIYLDAAASMHGAFDVILEEYKKVQPNVTVSANYGSSGTLLSQIEESKGIGHDIFFSAGKKQVQILDEVDHLVVEGSTVELLGNALVLATYKGSETKVTGWDDLQNATSMALCDGTVPVGQYTRKLLVAKGILPQREDRSTYSSSEISKALKGLEINECADVSAAAAAVQEHANEIGTMYYTDYYGFQDDLTILAMDKTGAFTGPIIYPVCQVSNPEADDAQRAAAADFLSYLQSQEALAIFEQYCFVVR